MNLIRKYFDDGAGSNSGGSPDPTLVADPSKVADPNAAAPPAELPQPVFTIDELKELGFDSKESAIAAFNKMKEDNKPNEEKQRQANIEKANFLKYAAERNFVNDDFNKYESLQSKADRDLVFEKFSAEEKADNPKITDEELKESFESEYKLTNDNEKSKAKGEARLKKDAEELRNPAKNAWEKAQSSYKEELSVWEKNKSFKTTVKDILDKNVSAKYSFKAKDGEEDVDVELDITPELRKELEKSFLGEKSFAKFLTYDEGKEKDFYDTLKANAQNFVEAKLAKAAVQEAIKIGVGRGTKKGSNIGAEAPFAVQNNAKTGQTIKDVSLEQANNNLGKIRKQFSKR